MDERRALTDASDATHARLRQRYTSDRAIGYAASDTRVYGFMRVADAVRYYSALHADWNAAQLAADLEAAGLGAQLEVRRMKTAYQRALVLALIAAARPAALVVERADQFDVAPAASLLEGIVRRTPRSLVTYAPGALLPETLFDVVAPAGTAELG